jgi:hypothetical protein
MIVNDLEKHKQSKNIKTKKVFTLASGARQLVVQEALEMTFMSALYSVLLTPITKVGVSSDAGALMIT